MKIYQKPDGSKFAFEDDGSQDSYITDDMTLLTADQIAAAYIQTPTQLWAAYQQSAQIELSVSDITMGRIFEAVALGNTTYSAADVIAFIQWRKTIRTILSQKQPKSIPPTLPIKPPFPAGT